MGWYIGRPSEAWLGGFAGRLCWMALLGGFGGRLCGEAFLGGFAWWLCWEASLGGFAEALLGLSGRLLRFPGRLVGLSWGVSGGSNRLPP